MNIEEPIERLKLHSNSTGLCLNGGTTCIVNISDLDWLLTAYEKEKEKNKKLYNPSDMILRYFDNKKGMQVEIKGFISKDKIKEIIKPTPENGIPIEVQQSEMYKKLLKEVEE